MFWNWKSVFHFFFSEQKVDFSDFSLEIDSRLFGFEKKIKKMDKNEKIDQTDGYFFPPPIEAGIPPIGLPGGLLH